MFLRFNDISSQTHASRSFSARMTVTTTKVPSPKHISGHELREIRRDRHSASPKSHCVASHSVKKGGGGGKYTWGTTLDHEGPTAIDKQDPNYDDESPETPSEEPSK